MHAMFTFHMGKRHAHTLTRNRSRECALATPAWIFFGIGDLGSAWDNKEMLTRSYSVPA